MISLIIRVSLALLVLNIFLTPVNAFGGFRGKGSTYGKTDPGKPKVYVGTSSGLPSQQTTRRGLGISAWGLIILIVGLILAGTGLYYFSICYSICQPTKSKYDKMSMPTLA